MPNMLHLNRPDRTAVCATNNMHGADDATRALRLHQHRRPAAHDRHHPGH
jgi:hypothetical protein